MRFTRTALLLTTTLVALLSSGFALAEEETDNSIQAQPLTKALAEFAEQTGMQLVYPSELTAGVDSNGASTEGTPDEILDQLLASTGLDYEYVNDRTIAIQEPSPADQGGDSDSGNVRLMLMTHNQTQASTERAFSSEQETQKNQEKQPPVSEETRGTEALEEIIVTGTNIRGIAPESSPTIVFDREDIDRFGFLTTDEFIRSIPQNFGGGANNVTPVGVPVGSAGDLEAQSNNVLGAGVNLRGLGAGSTLTLLNGRRLSPSGSDSAFVDVSAIPLSVVERVEVLTDGASSIYGGDAVGGVVNFVLSDDYQGAETSLTYGSTTEGGRDEFRANQTLGTSWGSGNGILSYEYLNQDVLFADEKDFSAAAPDPLSLLPGQERHSVIGNLSQEITPRLEISVSGFFSDRQNERVFNREGDTRPVIFEEGDQRQFLIAPMIKHDAGKDWRLVLAGDYSETTGELGRQDLDKVSGVLDPLEVSRNEASQSSVDLIADGPLFEARGGTVRLAIGGAFRSEDHAFTSGSGATTVDIDRDVWAGFGEFFIPIVGDQNSIPFVRRLELSASARHDNYSDFGGSTNPKFGLLWSPIEGLSLRGSYSTSFNPPNLGVVGAPRTSALLIPTLNSETGLRDVQYLLIGGNDVDNLDPEESETFTAGFDYNAPVFGGELSVSASYYNISFDDRIGAVPTPLGFTFFNAVPFLDQYPAENVSFDPSRSEVDALIADSEANLGFTDFVSVLGDVPSNLDAVAFILDSRNRNLASTETDGVDFDVRYSRDLGPGELTLGVAGDYILDFTNQATSTTPEVPAFNRVFNPVDFRARGTVSWSSDAFTASVFVNHTDGYTDDRVDPFARVDAWTTVDLNLGYRFDAGNAPKVLEGTRVALSVRNLFDQDPPLIESDDFFSVSFFDGANATPLGRLVSINLVRSW